MVHENDNVQVSLTKLVQPNMKSELKYILLVENRASADKPLYAILVKYGDKYSAAMIKKTKNREGLFAFIRFFGRTLVSNKDNESHLVSVCNCTATK